MKFKYNIPKNTFKMFGEANYVVAHQKKFLNDSKNKIKNFYYAPILITILLFLLVFLGKSIDESVGEIFDVLFTISYLYLGWLLISYFNFKHNFKEGELKVDKKGITDIRDIMVIFPWDKVKLIGITKNMMVILSENPLLMFLIEPNEELLDEILKYKDVKIIRNK